MTLNKINKLLIIALAPFLYLASTGVSATPIEILNDTSFESAVSSQGSQTSWTSSAYGSWGVGDPLGTVSSAPGISPLTGNKMLQFGTTGGSSSDIYQIVDVSGYATEIDAGLASVDLSIFFNAGSANSSMGLRLGGWTAAPTNFGGFTLLGGGFNNIAIGGDG